MDINQKGEMLIYQTEKGETQIDVYMEDNTIWLSRINIAKLYGTSPQNITMHIKNIYAEEELKEASTSKDYLLVQNEGGRQVSRNIKFYNLDMILAIGYRVRSNVGMQFRNWTSKILKEYMQKGFVMNDDRLKNPKKFGEDSLDEFLQFRRREILEGKGKVSRKQMENKVLQEYAIYNTRRLKTSIEENEIDILPPIED